MAFVQANQASADGSANTITTTLNGVAAGNLIFVAVSFGGVSIPGVGLLVSDGTNTYAQIRQDRDTGNSQSLATWYAYNVTGGNYTFTADFSNGATTSRNFRRIAVCEYSGINTTAPLDVENGNKQGTGSSSTDGDTATAVVTTVNGETVIGALMNTGGSNTIAAGTNFTERSDLGGLEVEDLVQSTAGSINATWTLSGTNAYIGFVATFKAAAAAATKPKSLLMVGVG